MDSLPSELPGKPIARNKVLNLCFALTNLLRTSAFLLIKGKSRSNVDKRNKRHTKSELSSGNEEAGMDLESHMVLHLGFEG